MNLLVSPLPLFNKNMEVVSYYLSFQKGNSILSKSQSALALDGCFTSPLLELINKVGLESLTLDKPIFIPITNILLLLDLENQCEFDLKKAIFVLENDNIITDEHIEKIKYLKELGYRFCVQSNYNVFDYVELLKIIDYVVFDKNIKNLVLNINDFKNKHKNVKVLVCDIEDTYEYNSLKNSNIDLFDGRFYSVPITSGKSEISTLKSNYIQLLNLVNDEDFEIEDFTKIVQKDPALVIKFLKIVNSISIGIRSEIKTIKHAAVMLGQSQIKKWINTVVTNSLSEDKPNEITRISLIRARFAENLAGKFDLSNESQSLFLMGLFSVLDVILEMKMEEAMEVVKISSEIKEALVNKKGEFYKVYELIIFYEMGDWQNVSRILILNNISVEEIFNLYIDAIVWYSKVY